MLRIFLICFAWVSAAWALPENWFTHVVCGEPAQPPRMEQRDEMLFDLPFGRLEAERFYWDFPVTLSDQQSQFSLIFKASALAPFQNISVHLKRGQHWGSAQPSVEQTADGLIRLTCTRASFTDEQGPFTQWAQSSLLRLSFWRNQQRQDVTLALTQFEVIAPQIGILLPDENIAPGESWLGAQQVRRLTSLFQRAGYPSAPFTVRELEEDRIDPFRVVVIPYAPRLTVKQIDGLKRCSEGGKKLVFFYQSSRALAEWMQVEVMPYRAAKPGLSWTTWNWIDGPCAGTRVPAPTTNLLPLRPITPEGRVVATWRDNQGLDTPWSACVVTPRGAWFSYLPPLASREAVSVVTQLLHAWLPGQTAYPRSFGVEQRAWAQKPARIGVWIAHPESRNSAGWSGSVQQLASLSVSDIFVHLQSGGIVYFPVQDRDVVTGQTPLRPEDSLEALVRAARQREVRVHAWITCWSLEGAPATFVTRMKEQRRLLKGVSGESLPWLDPQHPSNQALLLDGIRALSRRGVGGIHLDYIRYPDGYVLEKPEAQQAVLTRFIQDVRRCVQHVDARIMVSAAVYPTPASALARGQRWSEWVENGSLDFVCPMTYANATRGFEAMAQACVGNVKNPARVFLGIGYAADESQLDSVGIAEQVAVACAVGSGGVVFFAYDENLLTCLPKAGTPLR